MWFLVFAIVFSTFNHLMFKAFARCRIDLLSAIVINYVVCVVIGYSSSIASISLLSVFGQNWYPFSVVQGGLLVACLFLIGWTTARQGVSIASLAARLSVAIPTVIAFFLYGDAVTTLKIAGILAALVALYLSGVEDGKTAAELRAINLLPFILFVGFGVHSALLKFVQARFLDNTSYHAYVMASFFMAFLISGLVLAWRIFKRRYTISRQDMAAGLLLGCTNYGAVYFLIRALGVPGWQSSQLFPTISIAVVGLSSLGAWVVFNERLQRRMVAALTIGIAAIVLVNL
jgi:drug/metabolite transporter (DMT)-like permease